MGELDLPKKESLKVLFLHTGGAPVVFYRMIQYADHMGRMDDIYPVYPKFSPDSCDNGVRGYEENPDGNFEFLSRLFEFCDIAVVGMVHNLKFWALVRTLATHYKVPLLMECDDNPFEIDGSHENYNSIGIGSEVERNNYDQVKDSDGVIASTNYLAEELRCFNRNVHVIPNSINIDQWAFSEKRMRKETIIGWAGAFNHFRDLSIIKEVFEIILYKYKFVKIRCLHGAVGLITHPRFENIFKWSPINAYPRSLRNLDLDIAVAPLWDSEFNRCKSNLRYLEYSALKIPTVASRVEPFIQTIDDGIDGYLAGSTDEWLDKLSNLIENKANRKRIGKNAFRKIVLKYNSKSVAREYADLLKSIYDGSRRADVHLCSASG